MRCWYVGGAAVEAGGFTCVHWSRLEEEGADSCRGEGRLSAGAVGVTEEGAATPVAAGKSGRELLGKSVATSAVAAAVGVKVAEERKKILEKRGREREVL